MVIPSVPTGNGSRSVKGFGAVAIFCHPLKLFFEPMAELGGGGETAKDPSGWSTDTLKAYIERVIVEHDRRYEERFVAQQMAVRAALDAAAEATMKAEQNAERWRNNANEWRAAMTDREKNFMSQGQANTQFDALEKQIALLNKRNDIAEGRIGGVSAGWGWLVGAVGLIGSIIAIFLAVSQ